MLVYGASWVRPRNDASSPPCPASALSLGLQSISSHSQSVASFSLDLTADTTNVALLSVVAALERYVTTTSRVTDGRVDGGRDRTPAKALSFSGSSTHIRCTRVHEVDGQAPSPKKTASDGRPTQTDPDPLTTLHTTGDVPRPHLLTS